jgi:hypothetical protein
MLFLSAISEAICDLVRALAIFNSVMFVDVYRKPIKAGSKPHAQMKLRVLLGKLQHWTTRD